MRAIFITALLFTSLTVNVMTYLPRCTENAPVQVAFNKPPALNIGRIVEDLDRARGAK